MDNLTATCQGRPLSYLGPARSRRRRNGVWKRPVYCGEFHVRPRNAWRREAAGARRRPSVSQRSAPDSVSPHVAARPMVSRIRVLPYRVNLACPGWGRRQYRSGARRGDRSQPVASNCPGGSQCLLRGIEDLAGGQQARAKRTVVDPLDCNLRKDRDRGRRTR